MFSFEQLTVYQETRKLIKYIYFITDKVPSKEDFGLKSQIKKAAISIASNIAEGSGRNSVKEKIHFISIAYGSLMEVYCQLQIAADLNYISTELFDDIAKNINPIANTNPMGVRISFFFILSHLLLSLKIYYFLK